MKFKLSAFILYLFVLINPAGAGSYEKAVAEWTSYEEVAYWLKMNFSFDKSRQIKVIKRIKKQGPSGALYRNPAVFYKENGRGYCADSANFAINSLNRIDPSYNARWDFIWNEKGFIFPQC